MQGTLLNPLHTEDGILKPLLHKAVSINIVGDLNH